MRPASWSPSGVKKPIDLMGLRQIARPVRESRALQDRLEVHLVSGGVMLVDSAALSPEAVTVAVAACGKAGPSERDRPRRAVRLGESRRRPPG